MRRGRGGSGSGSGSGALACVGGRPPPLTNRGLLQDRGHGQALHEGLAAGGGLGKAASATARSSSPLSSSSSSSRAHVFGPGGAAGQMVLLGASGAGAAGYQAQGHGSAAAAANFGSHLLHPPPLHTQGGASALGQAMGSNATASSGSAGASSAQVQALAASWQAAAVLAASLVPPPRVGGQVAGQTPVPTLAPLPAVAPSLQLAFGGGGSDDKASYQDSYQDSFDRAPADPQRLLIHEMDLAPEQLGAASAPDVVAQLKAVVGRMQQELGEQEVNITGVLGQGGSGVVYLGLWRGLTVAVKSLTFTVVPSQPVTRRQQRAMSEAAICRTLHHPNIVATYSYDLQLMQPVRTSASSTPRRSTAHSDHLLNSNNNSNNHALGAAGMATDPPSAGSVDGTLASTLEVRLYIIQEHCDGGTLTALIDEGRLAAPPPPPPPSSAQHQATSTSVDPPPPRMGPLLQLAADVAAGMAHVHSRNIVHGDLTPANVLLRAHQPTESGCVAKVADFGLSWKLTSGQDHVSNARQGTAYYIAPEVLNVGVMSKAADVFSFGMMLHEMYHGTPLWRRKGGGKVHMTELAAAAARRRPGLDQLQWAPHCPLALRDLACACLAYDPHARPHFTHILAELQAMLRAASPSPSPAAARAAAAAGEGSGGGGGGTVSLVQAGVHPPGHSQQQQEQERGQAGTSSVPTAAAALDDAVTLLPPPPPTAAGHSAGGSASVPVPGIAGGQAAVGATAGQALAPPRVSGGVMVAGGPALALLLASASGTGGYGGGGGNPAASPGQPEQLHWAEGGEALPSPGGQLHQYSPAREHERPALVQPRQEHLPTHLPGLAHLRHVMAPPFGQPHSPPAPLSSSSTGAWSFDPLPAPEAHVSVRSRLGGGGGGGVGSGTEAGTAGEERGL